MRATAVPGASRASRSASSSWLRVLSSPLSPRGRSGLRSRFRFRPDRRDRDHLFMQPRRAGAIDGEPAHQHDTRLRARPKITDTRDSLD